MFYELARLGSESTCNLITLLLPQATFWTPAFQLNDLKDDLPGSTRYAAVQDAQLCHGDKFISSWLVISSLFAVRQGELFHPEGQGGAYSSKGLLTLLLIKSHSNSF